MALQPEDWNAVVLGRWNAALFTPSGVSQRVFQLPNQTPVEVFVVLDEVQLPHVKYEGMTAIPSSSQLIIAPEQCTFANLGRAAQLASNAIEELSKTPLTAAAFNVRYRDDVLPPVLAERFSVELDGRFSDSGFDILGRQFYRSLRWGGDGRLLVRVTWDPDAKAEVLLNFERKSKDTDELRSWLSTPMNDVQCQVKKILETILQLREDEYVGEYEHAGQQQVAEPEPRRD